MAKAKKLPSGSWRARPFVGLDENGKRLYKSFTADTKKEAEYMAAEYLMNNKAQKKPSTLTVGAAIDRYIESKDAILSPSTVRGYRQMQKKYLKGIAGCKLESLTPEAVQKEINTLSKTLSPKTVRNINGLLTSTLREYHPSFAMCTTLPPREKPDLYIPTEQEVNDIMRDVYNTPMEVPIILAAYLGLRKSEILGLKWSKIDLTNKTLIIDEARVKNDKGQLISKAPKSYAGKRTIDIPDPVINALLRNKTETNYVCQVPEGMIYKNFIKILDSNEIKRFRFHDLRHYHASVMLALGVPDKYAMERLGHATNDMLKNVYQHTMTDRQKDISNTLNNYFMHHEMHHEK